MFSQTPLSHDAGPAGRRPLSFPRRFFPVSGRLLAARPEASRLQQQALYEWAYQQAREVLRPSLLERDLLAVWN